MLRYEIDTQASLVVVSAAGAVDAHQVRAIRETLKSDPRYHPGLSVLLDLSGAASFEFTAGELRQLAGSVMTQPTARQAIVVGSELGFGLGRMFQVFSQSGPGGESVQVFRTADEARAWLGSPSSGA